MSWVSQKQMFNSFQAKEKSHHQHQSENVTYDVTSRNNLKPIRTFGRDISNLQRQSAFMQDRNQPHSKGKKIRLKYPKNSVGRRKFGFEMSKRVNTSAIRSTVASKRYISSSSLTDRNKNFQMMNPNTKHQLYKRKIPVFKETKPRVNSIKPLNKSLKNRSMSRSQLGGKENMKGTLRYASDPKF